VELAELANWMEATPGAAPPEPEATPWSHLTREHYLYRVTHKAAMLLIMQAKHPESFRERDLKDLLTKVGINDGESRHAPAPGTVAVSLNELERDGEVVRVDRGLYRAATPVTPLGQRRRIFNVIGMPWIRANKPSMPGAAPSSDEDPADIDIQQVWSRIVSHAGETFTQIRGQEFTYAVNNAGNSIGLSTTNQSLPRSIFATALERVPFTSTVALQDLRGPSYLYAILMDDRIRQAAW
jgi:hypothetical protein